MTDASPRNAARHTHLIRAAQSAGEVFAYTTVDGERRRRENGRAMTALWIGAGALAALGLYLTF